MVTLRLKCQSKKQTDQYKDKEGNQVVSHEITFFLGYASDPKDPNYPFTQLSGGTAMTLMTVNDAAAAKFEVGKWYPLEFGDALD